MRYPEDITLEVRNEEPDKKRRFPPRSVLKHSLTTFTPQYSARIQPKRLGRSKLGSMFKGN